MRRGTLCPSLLTVNSMPPPLGRMFALLDLAFEPSRACHGGGYSAVRGRYSKRHYLLAMPLFDVGLGDPIYLSTDPFELMHKLKTRPAFQNSLKHAATVARSILMKVRSAVAEAISCCRANVICSVSTGHRRPRLCDPRASGSWPAPGATCTAGCDSPVAQAQ